MTNEHLQWIRQSIVKLRGTWMVGFAGSVVDDRAGVLMDRRRRVGGYTLREQLRVGSNRAVFRSGNPFGRLAVTLVAGDSLPAESFRHRAEAVAALRHKSILPLYDFGSDDDCLYFVTKYLDGETLAGFLATEGRLPPVEAAEIASDILDGLAVAHKKGLVHGGLTPSSIMVSTWSRAVITDLAIPWKGDLGDVVDELPDESGEVASAHSSRYLPPEKLRGGDPDERWDVYSVGAILFEMLTGTKPGRPGRGPGDLATEWPPSGIEAVAPALESTVLQALSSEPGERFPTAAEMRAALHASSQRRSALAEAVGDQDAPASSMAEPALPHRPKTPPRHALSPTAASEAARPKLPRPKLPAGPKAERSSRGPAPGAPPATRSPAPRGGVAGRSFPYPGFRRQYKHRAARRIAAGSFFRSGRWRPVALAVALGVGAILTLFALFALSINVFLEDEAAGERRAPEKVSTAVEEGQQSTPFLLGKTVEAARADLERKGLKVGEITSEPNGSVAPKHILDQRPAGGIRVPRGASVDLVVAVEPPNG